MPWCLTAVFRRNRRGLFLAGIGVASAATLLSGCRGIPARGETEARQRVAEVSRDYRPDGKKPPLPELTTNSTLADFLRYSLLNQPKVAAAYFDWVASVERITVQRSLPDPQVTFQADIADVVTSLMPGLMMSFPGAGKLRAAGAVAVAESQGKYFAFRSAALESAFGVKRAYYRLHFLEEKLRVNRENLELLRELERLARSRNEVGKATLQDVLRARIEQERLGNEIANLEDSRDLLRARWQAALGVPLAEPTPPVPARFESTSLEVAPEKWLGTALAENTRLKGMAAEVRAADDAIRLAYKARMPDTSLGFMADAKMAPVLYRPTGAVSIPLWRDKLAAQVAEARAAKQAGEARLTAGEIDLAVAVAERSFIFRETTRNLQLLVQTLLPMQRQSLEVARTAYLSGQLEFVNVTDAEQGLLRFELDEVEARVQRELSLAELSLILMGMPPGAADGAAMAGSPGVEGAGNMGGAMPKNGGGAGSKPMNQGGMK